MKSALLSDKELRAELLARVEAIGSIIAETAVESEQRRALAPRTLAALKGAGLLRMRVPAEAGGWDATPATTMLVLARIAEIDPPTAWNVMVFNNSTAFIGAFLPDPGFSEVFGKGVPICAGVAPPYGEAVACDGGFRVSGRWRLCSGVIQAEWVRLATVTKETTPRRLFIIVPQATLEIIDNWHVIALSGTGSNDVALADHFVPEHMTFWKETRMRGGPQHRQRGLVASSYEHTAIAIGIARRALREAAGVLAKRSNPREMHLNQLGRLQIQLDAITSLVLERFERDYDDLADPAVDPDTIGINNLAMSAHATELASECVEAAYRTAGSLALYRPNIFERLLRDVHGATQHVAVLDGHFTDLGARLAQGR